MLQQTRSLIKSLKDMNTELLYETLVDVRDICNKTPELQDNSSFEEIARCDQAITEILELVDNVLP